MTRTLLLALAALLFTTTLSAQRRGPQRSAEERAQKLTELQDQKVGFSAEQKAQVQAVNLEAFKKMDDARATAQGDRQAMLQAIRQINQDRDAQTVALLTEEQKPKYEAAKEEFRAWMRERMQQRRGGRGGAGLGD